MATLSSLADGQKALTKEDKFFRAFGQFVCTFAMVESGMHQAFRLISNLGHIEARAIMGGARLIDVVSTVQRLIPRSKLAEDKRGELGVLLSQLQVISTFRHALIHRGATVSATEIVSSNFMTAKTIESVEELKFQLDHVEAATNDLNCLGIRLSAVFQPELLDGLPQMALDYLHQPWRYKPLPPSRPLSQLQPKPPKPPHPRRPARG